MAIGFADLAIKNKNSMGNILTRNAIHKIEFKEKGSSTLGGNSIWWDADVQRLNTDAHGTLLGEFHGGDKILSVTKAGEYRLSSFDLTNHYEDDLLLIEKFKANKVFSAVYFDAEQKLYYLKRFTFEATERLSNFVDDENANSKLILLTSEKFPQIKIKFGGKHKTRPEEVVDVEQFISVKGYKAKGKRLTTFEVATIEEIEPLEKEELMPEEPESTEGEDLPPIDESKVFDNGDSNPIQPSLF
jgi:topoisomerase-4 subunit A